MGWHNAIIALTLLTYGIAFPRMAARAGDDEQDRKIAAIEAMGGES
jgi:hypothetical protein